MASGGMLPGMPPPMSTQWVTLTPNPSSAPASKIGAIRQMSQMWVAPAYGSLVM